MPQAIWRVACVVFPPPSCARVITSWSAIYCDAMAVKEYKAYMHIP